MTNTVKKMKWIKASEELPSPEMDEVLAVCLDGFFGKLIEKPIIAYYDDPSDYEDPNDGGGWKAWYSDERPQIVTHWMPIPEMPKGKLDGIEQKDFKEKFGSFHPNLGTVDS